MARLLPTTRAQVSGHKFLRRRVEHGVIFGDIRMIHDPLGARRRATVFGCAAAVMIAGVMGLFAWMRPNPDPGDAPIMRAADGSLYVRVGEAVHPVTNLTSARLIAGSPDQPARVGDEHLAAMGRGVPLGLITAPSMFAPDTAPEAAWAVCTQGSTVTVSAGTAPEPLLVDDSVAGPAGAVLAADDTRQWLITAEGRRALPPAESAQGRIVRRALQIGPDTPVWRPPAQVLVALRELPPVQLPNPLPRILDAGDTSWMLTDGRVQPITQLQRGMLLDAGAAASDITRDQVANYPDGDAELTLPGETPRWVDPARTAVCVNQDRAGAVMDSLPAGVQLSGASVATHFAGLAHGAVGVDSGHGFHVVSGSGLRHQVPDRATLDTVGALHVEEVPWEIIALLPEGDALTRDAALTATY